MRAPAILAVIYVLCAFSAAAQDIELTSRTPTAIEATLRSSCYCINCGPDEVPQLAQARCRFVRWGAYPFIGAAAAPVNAQYAQDLDAQFATFAAFISAYKGAVPNGDVEYVLPEIVTQGIQTVTLGDLAGPLNRLNLVPGLTSAYRFSFDRVYNAPRGDKFWSKGDGVERNGVPSLITPEGRLWAAYLAARAMRAGADAVNFAQPQLRVRNTDDLEFTVRKLRQLRTYVSPGARPLLFGTSATHHLTRGTSTLPLSRFIDYTKVKIDIDSYFVADGVRYVRRQEPAGRDRCEILGTSQDATLLPLPPPATDQYLCMIATNRPERATRPGEHEEVSFDQANPFHLRVLMELDGVQRCSDGTRRVWYYAPDLNEQGVQRYPTDCYAAIRHALPTTMYFLSRSAPARSAFIEYMYRLAQRLTATKGYGVYFPLPIKVDQNEMQFVLKQVGCPVTSTCDPQLCSQPRDFERLTQVKLVPGCPTDSNPEGLKCGVAQSQYFARTCAPDFEKIRTLLP